MTRDEFKAGGFIGSPNCSRLHPSRVLDIPFPYQSTTFTMNLALSERTPAVFGAFFIFTRLDNE